MVQFRFINDAPPQQIYSDIQTLNAFPEDALVSFTELLLNFLGSSGVDVMEVLSSFSSEHNIGMNMLKNTVRGVLFFFKGAIRSNLTPLFLKEDLVSFGLNEDRANLIANQWKQKFVSISRSAMSQTLMVNQVIDMEWKFGTTAANSDISKVGSSYIQMKMVLDKGNGQVEDVYMELTLPQFYEFFSEMQKAKTNLEFFTL